MHPIKYVWALRMVMYRPFFKKIGTMSYMGKPCFIEGCKKISIGKKTRIFPGIRMEAIGSGSIAIGNNCAIEQNVHIISQGNRLCIGDDTTISANVFVSNVDHDYKEISRSVMDQPVIEKHTEIGEGCFIGYGAIILPGTKLGKHCIVGSNTVVKGVYSDNSVIVGVPGRVIKKFDLEKRKWIKK